MKSASSCLFSAHQDMWLPMAQGVWSNFSTFHLLPPSPTPSPTSTYRKTWLGGTTLSINILPRTHSVTYTDSRMLRPCKAIPAHRTGMLCLECARAHQNMWDSITEEGHTWTLRNTQGHPHLTGVVWTFHWLVLAFIFQIAEDFYGILTVLFCFVFR